METLKVYINSDTHDAGEAYGIHLAESSITALMTPAPLKSYVSNTSALFDGKEVFAKSEKMPKDNEREVQLTFSLEANSLAQFYLRYRSFCDMLKSNVVNLTIRISEGSTFFQETYRLLYLSCSQYSAFNGRLAKFVIKFCEPNPKNRIVETSEDIEL